MFEFDELIEEVGSFGPYQVRVFILVSLFETPAAWAMFLPVFSQSVPTWICYDNSTRRNSSNFTELENMSKCMDNGDFCENVCITSDYTSIYEDFNLCGDSKIPSLITTLQMVGVLFGAFITGQLADTFGRKRIIFVVYLFLSTAGLLTSFSMNWQLYAVCRILVGIFFGGTMVINFVLPLEFVGPKWRTFCGCIGFWAVGVMTLAPLAYFLRNWRYLTIVCSCLGLPLMLTWWFIDESPRWLIQKGRIKQAENILKKIAISNKNPLPEFSKLRNCADASESVKRERKKYSYWDLFRNCNMTKNTLIVMYSWFVSSCVYYGTTLNVGNLSGNKYLNFFLSGLVEIPALIFVVLVNNKIGRKKTLSLLMLIAGLSCFVIIAIKHVDKSSHNVWAVTTFAMIGKSGISGGWAAAQVFSAEIFPTVVRNIGIGACSMMARIGGILAPQLVALNDISSPLPFIVFGAMALLCGVLSCLLPETLNAPLPDTLPQRTFSLCCRKPSNYGQHTQHVKDENIHQVSLSDKSTSDVEAVLLTKVKK